MIYTQHVESVVGTLFKLHESKFKFQLTGSAFFGSPNPHDLDFFVQDDDEVREFLKHIGFGVSGGHAPYLDSNTVEVYRKGRLDVQVVRSFKEKVQVQTALKQTFPNFSLLSKSQQKQLWEFGFSVQSAKSEVYYVD